MSESNIKLRDGRIVRSEEPLNLEMPFEKLEDFVGRTLINKNESMRRTAITALSILFAASAAHGTDVTALADRFVQLRLSSDPTIAYFTGLKAPNNSALRDLSPPGIRALEAKEDALCDEVLRIDAAHLKPAEKPIYAVLKETLEADRGLRVCKNELWDVSQMTGWQVAFVDVAKAQPVGTASLRAEALSRWRSLPAYIQTDIDNLRSGLKQGYSAPKSVVNRVVTQLDGLLALSPEKSPFYSPAERDGDADFKEQFRKLVADQINPALKKFRDFLTDEYLPKARETISVFALPNGKACYQAFLRKFTTLDRTPEQVFALGEKTVAENKAAVIELGRKLYGTDEFEAIVRKDKEAPRNHFTSKEELLAYSNRLLARTLEKSRPLFLKLPDQPVVIEPVPEYQTGSGVQPHYLPQPDTSKPGKYIIPLETWQSDNRGAAEVVLVHETVPGHHLQIALAREFPHPSDIFKLADNSAYIEGWARYAERLSEEAGIYETEYARIARRIWPARGMVVDPGIHAFGWTRQRAIDYVKSTGRFDDKTADALVNRIAVLPGQLTAYDSGGLEIFALRREAEAALGSKFDVREFHQRVLEEGVVPLEELKAHMREWIRSQPK
jgi:uncharacterized protein (DUF885 family)